MSGHKLFTHLVVAITLITGVGLTVDPVSAQPLNDNFANAYVISGPRFSDSGSTADATESPDDPAVANGSFCGGGNTIWYSLAVATTSRVAIDTFGSDYGTTLGVYAGGPGALSEVTCYYDSVGFDAAAGVTYSIVVGTCCWAGNLFGGNYVLSATITELPPPLDIALTINRGSVNKATGAAVISGTVTCSNPGWFDFYVLVEQRSGNTVVRGEAWTSEACDGATPVNLTIRPGGSSPFKGGRAGVVANVSGCDGFTCDGAHIESTFKL